MQKLHDFMERMRAKSVAERERLLIVSMTVLGLLVLTIGVWNISSNLVALNQSNSVPDDASNLAVEAPSITERLRTEAASVWGSVQGSLKEVNNKLGPAEPQQTNE